jgi:hypothetical protein
VRGTVGVEHERHAGEDPEVGVVVVVDVEVTLDARGFVVAGPCRLVREQATAVDEDRQIGERLLHRLKAPIGLPNWIRVPT